VYAELIPLERNLPGGQLKVGVKRRKPLRELIFFLLFSLKNRVQLLFFLSDAITLKKRDDFCFAEAQKKIDEKKAKRRLVLVLFCD
jgi:hypothetical protein